ncbi:phosphatase PAP2 family protein [Candidatus Saccharibacteria bacterium]|nr:phosphatase PAP2 family protein [Candidatus Saccharibacteria bacterium]
MDNLIIFLAEDLIIIIVLATLAAWFKTTAKTRWQFAFTIVLSGILALALSKLAGLLYFHDRPFVVQSITPLIPHGDDNAFPSDHMLWASTLATVVYLYHRRLGIVVSLLALFVGAGRVLAHVHWPIDIIGGLALGALGGWTGYQIAKRLLPDGQQAAIDE